MRPRRCVPVLMCNTVAMVGVHKLDGAHIACQYEGRWTHPPDGINAGGELPLVVVGFRIAVLPRILVWAPLFRDLLLRYMWHEYTH